MEPRVFISYSHDDESHKDWVLQLATRLRLDGVDILLDRWELKLGQDIASFIEKGLSSSNRIICICSETYVNKADQGQSGVGYEKQIMTAELMSNLNTNLVIPVIKNNSKSKKVPVFLGNRLYISFEDKTLYENNYEKLLRELLAEPILPIPPIGKNPFKTIKNFAKQKFIPNTEKYVSPAVTGKVTFDYSNNNGLFCIGQGELLFELYFSKASDRRIHILNDPMSIKTVAVVKDEDTITNIVDARNYDGSSRVRTVSLNQIAVLQNANGFFAAIKILDIKDDTRGSKFDEVTLEYIIQTDGSPDFTSLK